MNAKRVVLVLPDPPLPFGNAAARWYYVLLKGLVERGHRVTTLAACRAQDDQKQLQTLFPVTQFELRCHPVAPRSGWRAKWQTLRQPYRYTFSPAFVRDLKKTLSRGYDVLHLEQLWSGWLGLEHTERAIVNVHYLYSIDLADASLGSMMNTARHLATLRAEKSLLRRFPTVCTLTPRLSRRVQEINPHAQVHTVPLGIDLSLYPFRPTGTEHQPPTVGLIGSFNWHPSRTAGMRLLTRLWPEIKRRVPTARLQLVGRHARQTFHEYTHLADVSFHEDVPEILPWFQTTDVLLYAPRRGSGMKVKVVEAFALGTPVVTTSEGVEGLPAKDGTHAGISDDDTGLITRTVELLQDSQRRQRQAHAAKLLVNACCNPDTTLSGIERCYCAMLESQHRKCA